MVFVKEYMKAIQIIIKRLFFQDQPRRFHTISIVGKADFAEKRLVFVVAMANDKDHLSFAKELLSGLKPEAVVVTEAEIGGGKVRSMACSVLKESWIKAPDELGLGFMEISENKSVFRKKGLRSYITAREGKKPNKASKIRIRSVNH